MNKKETAEFDATKKALAEARALRWSDYDPQPINLAKWNEENHYADYCNAWSFHAFGSIPRVEPGWFDGVNHGWGHRTDKRPNSASQRQGGPWYKTEVEATMALRKALEQRFAEALAAVDTKIAAGLGDSLKE
jgi:hypothetical protein